MQSQPLPTLTHCQLCDMQFQDKGSMRAMRLQALVMCRHRVDVAVALREGGGTLGSQLAGCLEAEARRVRAASPCSCGALLRGDGGTVSQVFGSAAAGGGDPRVELLCSPSCREDASGGPPSPITSLSSFDHKWNCHSGIKMCGLNRLGSMKYLEWSWRIRIGF